MRYASPSRQIPLLEVPPRYRIERNGQARNAYGSAAQEIVCRALGLDPIPIDGTCDCCFDAAKHGTNFEIKSVHKSSKVVCYDWRLMKEERAEAEGKRLFYAVLAHEVRAERDPDRLLPRMIKDARILIVAGSVVRRLALREPLHKMKALETPADPRNGYRRAGYADGYRKLPLKRLVEATDQWRQSTFELYGNIFTIPVLS